MESTPWELSNGMWHYAESAFCQDLQNRRSIPKSYLDANIFGSTNGKELEKSFCSTNTLQSTLIYIVYSDF